MSQRRQRSKDQERYDRDARRFPSAKLNGRTSSSGGGEWSGKPKKKPTPSIKRMDMKPPTMPPHEQELHRQAKEEQEPRQGQGQGQEEHNQLTDQHSGEAAILQGFDPQKPPWEITLVLENSETRKVPASDGSGEEEEIQIQGPYSPPPETAESVSDFVGASLPLAPPPPPPPPPKFAQPQKVKGNTPTSLEQAYSRMKAAASSQETTTTEEVPGLGKTIDDTNFTHYGYRALFNLQKVQDHGFTGIFSIELHATEPLGTDIACSGASETQADASWVSKSHYAGQLRSVHPQFSFGISGSFAQVSSKQESVYVNVRPKEQMLHVFVALEFTVRSACDLGLRCYPFDRHVLGLRVVCDNDIRLHTWKSGKNIRPPLTNRFLADLPPLASPMRVATRQGGVPQWWTYEGLQRVAHISSLRGDMLEADMCIQRHPGAILLTYGITTFMTVASSAAVLAVPYGEIESRLLLLFILYFIVVAIRLALSLDCRSGQNTHLTRLDWYMIAAQILLSAAILESVLANTVACSRSMENSCTFDVIFHLSVLAVWVILHTAILTVLCASPETLRASWTEGPGSS